MWDLNAPLWLLLFPLLWLWWWKYRSRPPRRSALLHPRTRLVAELQPKRRAPTPWLWLLGMSALILALAQPRWHDPQQVRELNGRDIVLALDMSASMRAEDFIRGNEVINRFDAVRDTAKHLMRMRPDDRIGIVVFADDAYTLVPVTFDHTLAATLLDSIEVGMAGEKTALGDALALAVNRLQLDRGRTRTIVLFSDGAATSGSVLTSDALDAAVASGSKVHSIGIGGERRSAFSQGPRSAPVLASVPLDEQLLRRIAERTGGEYFSGSDSDALRAASAAIDRIEASEGPVRLPPQADDFFWLPLLLALALIGAQSRRDALNAFP